MPRNLARENCVGGLLRCGKVGRNRRIVCPVHHAGTSGIRVAATWAEMLRIAMPRYHFVCGIYGVVRLSLFLSNQSANCPVAVEDRNGLCGSWVYSWYLGNDIVVSGLSRFVRTGSQNDHSRKLTGSWRSMLHSARIRYQAAPKEDGTDGQVLVGLFAKNFTSMDAATTSKS